MDVVVEQLVVFILIVVEIYVVFEFNSLNLFEWLTPPPPTTTSFSLLILQWDESFDDLLEGSPINMNILQLPSPNKWVVSPLKKYEIAKITRRRKIKKWSNFEDWCVEGGSMICVREWVMEKE
ncbi:hypothetical protein LguiB_033777 [Lonicera macranthoides]